MRRNSPEWANHKAAIELLAAFQRIVAGTPRIVSTESRLTQSLVATEAGYQRSTLNKHRYPELCAMIEAERSKGNRATTAKEKLAQKSSANKKLRARIEALEEQRDKLISQCVSIGKAYAEKCRQLRVLEKRFGVEPK